MQNKNILFEEKQYLGHNRLSIVIRTALAIFCLFSYYLSENSNLLNINIFIIQNNSNSGFIFFVVGNCILILSAALTFVLHIETKVYENYILLEGFWTSRKIKVDLNTIISIKKTRLKKTILMIYNCCTLGPNDLCPILGINISTIVKLQLYHRTHWIENCYPTVRRQHNDLGP